MHLYFIVFKNKKKDDYRLFTNTIFDKEKDADEFGRKSMKRGYEYKVLDYNYHTMAKRIYLWYNYGYSIQNDNRRIRIMLYCS